MKLAAALLAVALDGDGDGMAGGDHVFGDDAVDNFYRKYGDYNGNGIVELFDFTQFRSTFSKSEGEAGYIDSLDANGDLAINLIDFTHFAAVSVGRAS